jgi:3-oxoacyl-[acyl-carrier protein] reductase
MGRWGESREIADAILFLSSSAATFITGHTLVVDGGYSIID